MFENFFSKKLNIDFKKDSNCYAFEIPNFLSDEQYNILYQNFPKIGVTEASKINHSFFDTNSQHQLKASLTELDPENYSKYILSNNILEEFVKTIKRAIYRFFVKKFYFKILKSRILDPKTS